MDTNQIIIKSILIISLLLVALAIVVPGRSARGQAIRHLAWLLGLAVGAFAVLFPQSTDIVASWLGIGRGTDLVLYMFIVFFMGFAVTTTAHARKAERTSTVLARKIAILEAELKKRGYVFPKDDSLDLSSDSAITDSDAE